MDSHLNPKYNFDNYFEGTSNRLVRSSSEAIAQEPGKTFNPMFCVQGRPVWEKPTYAMRLVTEFRKFTGKESVVYISHLFTVQYASYPGKNTTNDFMYFYQGVDVLILDDIQELIRKDKTQNTFFIYSITCIYWASN